MTLEKAIELLELYLTHPFYGKEPDFHNSIKLGIEALKTVKEMRHYPFPDGVVELPGETKE